MTGLCVNTVTLHFEEMKSSSFAVKSGDATIAGIGTTGKIQRLRDGAGKKRKKNSAEDDKKKSDDEKGRILFYRPRGLAEERLAAGVVAVEERAEVGDSGNF